VGDVHDPARPAEEVRTTGQNPGCPSPKRKIEFPSLALRAWTSFVPWP
jgi:hypothetical protein